MLNSDDEVLITGQDNLLDAAFHHFKSAYKDIRLTNFTDQASIIGLYPRIITDCEAELRYSPCSKEEI
jgi:hypothetical protein